MNTLWNIVAGVFSDVVSTLQTFFSGVPLQVVTPQTQRKEFSVEVVRPDDLLVVTLDFYNLRLIASSGGTPAHVTRHGAGDGFIVAHFPPQSFAERAFFEAEPGSPGTEPLGVSPVPSRIAGRSQLVFRIRDPLLPLEFSLEAILQALTQSSQVVQSTIQAPVGTPPVGGNANFGGTIRSQFTAIEAPYRLVLSPSYLSRWEHAFAPVTDAANKRTELWHTRISAGAKAGAVWSPDFMGTTAPVPPPDQFPFRMSLNKRYRHQIVRLSADRSLGGSAQFELQRLMLSSQGAWLSSHGQWATELDLIEWRHIMTAGRDQHARVVKEGYLFPLGHRAVIVTITERKVQRGVRRLEGGPVAALRQRKLIFVRQPTRTYQHRHVPFRTATVKTLVTPNLDPPELSQVAPGVADTGFWPRVKDEDFLFHVVATDWEGREAEFRAPQMFIMKSLAHGAATAPQFVTYFNGIAATNARRACPMNGQKIAFAPAQKSGDTTLETAQLVFGAAGANAEPRFLPTMFTADVDVPPARQISGSAAPSKIAFDEQFLNATGTLIGNKGEV
nr:hypothetical protein [Chthoniobacterales bacterium]